MQIIQILINHKKELIGLGNDGRVYLSNEERGYWILLKDKSFVTFDEDLKEVCVEDFIDEE
jgi:hypothetical protein